ncbi:MAG: nucleotidyltransferase family protein [Elusimicrobia bacterium]|nr:nucleotidyltransferase family protein [Elusimicrobiota bacterium]
MNTKNTNTPKIKIDRKWVSNFCQKNHIKKLALFGSVLRQDFNPESDIDILVEFEPGHVPGLAFFKLEDELSTLLGRKVDLNTPNFLSPLIRSQVLSQSHIEYDAA